MLPQSAVSHLPEVSMFIVSGLACAVLLTVIFIVYASGLTIVNWPSPLDGGFVQANATLVVLPLRCCFVVLQSPFCAGISLRSTISLLMQTFTVVLPGP